MAVATTSYPRALQIIASSFCRSLNGLVPVPASSIRLRKRGPASMHAMPGPKNVEIIAQGVPVKPLPWCSMPKASQLDLSKTLGRILRYETHQYGLTPDAEGRVQLHDLMRKCGLAHYKDEVIHVACTSAGSRGRRFDLDEPAKGLFRIRARYSHGKGEGSKGKTANNFPSGTKGDSWKGHVGSPMPKPKPAATRSFYAQNVENENIWRQETQAPDQDCQDCFSGPQSFDISTPRNSQQETWQRYVDPTTQKVWFHNEKSGDVFFEDGAADSGWRKYDSDLGLWWWNETAATWFFERASN